jgi:hypothetical protein
MTSLLGVMTKATVVRVEQFELHEASSERDLRGSFHLRGISVMTSIRRDLRQMAFRSAPADEEEKRLGDMSKLNAR